MSDLELHRKYHEFVTAGSLWKAKRPVQFATYDDLGRIMQRWPVQTGEIILVTKISSSPELIRNIIGWNGTLPTKIPYFSASFLKNQKVYTTNRLNLKIFVSDFTRLRSSNVSN